MRFPPSKWQRHVSDVNSTVHAEKGITIAIQAVFMSLINAFATILEYNPQVKNRGFRYCIHPFPPSVAYPLSNLRKNAYF